MTNCKDCNSKLKSDEPVICDKCWVDFFIGRSNT